VTRKRNIAVKDEGSSFIARTETDHEGVNDLSIKEANKVIKAIP
jgi:hypothetical protein